MKTNWIGQRRRILGLNQDELAARLQSEGLDISRSTVSHWENGRYNPPFEDPRFRAALARALRMTIFDMLLSAGYEISNSEQSEESTRAAYIVDRLSVDKKKLAIAILEQMLNSEFS